MKKLYDELIKQLIEIGRTEIIPSMPDSWFSYLREGQWQRARYPKNCDDYSIDDLKLLYKGLVLCEKHFKWQVGSATNTAWVLRNIIILDLLMMIMIQIMMKSKCYMNLVLQIVVTMIMYQLEVEFITLVLPLKTI